MKAKSLLATIKALGGINVRELRDLSGEGRTGRAGIPVGLFRKPSAGGKSGLKVTGYGLDELIPMLIGQGFAIRTDDVDGGLQDLRDMIQAELSGAEKIYASDDAEEIWARELSATHAMEAESDNVRAGQSPRVRAVRQIAPAVQTFDIRAMLERAIQVREQKAA